MGVTLIINPGSSSKKYALYKEEELVLAMRYEQTGSGFSVCTEMKGTKGHCLEITANDFSNALSHMIDTAVKEKHIGEKQEISRVSIRIVAPSSYFSEHRIIDDAYIDKLNEYAPVAPLHIPSMLAEIEIMQTELSGVLCIGVSDSAFHTTIPDYIRDTSLPRDDAERFDFRKFGYHGLSVASAIARLQAKEGSVPERVIVCHVGGGISVTALQDGKSVATSMGYSPASGVMMGSRMGDVSADVLAGIIARKGLRGEAVFEYLYNEGGFKGVSGVTDLRLVLEHADKHDTDAQKALRMFVYQIRSWIGSHAMLLGGVDTIVLTATAAERNATVRRLLLDKVPLLGTKIDGEKNELLVGGEGYIEAHTSKTKIIVLKTDEIGEMYKITKSF